MFSEVKSFSPLPIVNLNDIEVPSDGLVNNLPSFCHKKFDSDDKCKLHYKEIRNADSNVGFVQCPYGFATLPVIKSDFRAALTAFVPYPRLRGENEDKERDRGKEYKGAKMTREAVHQAADAVREVLHRLENLEAAVLKRHAMALHEVRKLNGTVKRTAERICMHQSPQRPSEADDDLVKIWKSAELMSKQFDIVEIMANEDLTKLPLNSKISVYKAFDKCARILSEKRNIQMENLGGPSYDPHIEACDKTFTIIATVLIENAIRYSLAGSQIVVSLDRVDERQCRVEVKSYSDAAAKIDESIFGKGVRGSSRKEGSGNGLYVAQLVARQHNSEIELNTKRDMTYAKPRTVFKFSAMFQVIENY